MLILGIDTSGKSASAAVCRDDAILAESYALTKLTHSQVILPMCERVLADADVSLDDIECIAAAKGPGSYTGLRIGIGAVKGMCFGTDRKCAGISSLEALAYNFRGIDTVVCSVMFARQELVYGALFRSAGGKIERLSEDRILPASELAELAASYDCGRIYAAGDYSAQFTEKFPCERIVPAPPQLNRIRASSLCFAAENTGLIGAEELCADYLQLVKAEKDLEDKKALSTT